MKTKRVLIVNYHLIADEKDQQDSLGGIYTLTGSAFEAQMNWLSKSGLPVISLDELTTGQLVEPLTVVLTFDDGNSSDYEWVAPVLKKYGFTASFFISLYHLKRNMLSWGNYRELSRQGHCLGAHGVNHVDLTSLAESEAELELYESKRAIEQMTGCPVDYFSFPFGSYNQKLLNQAKKAGYRTVLSTRGNRNIYGVESYVYHRWSVKRKTTQAEFEAMVLGTRSLRFRKGIVNTGKRLAFRLLGMKLVNRINTYKHRNHT